MNFYNSIKSLTRLLFITSLVTVSNPGSLSNGSNNNLEPSYLLFYETPLLSSVQQCTVVIVTDGLYMEFYGWDSGTEANAIITSNFFFQYHSYGFSRLQYRNAC